MSRDVDSKIDELYQLPLAEFTAARNALAKTLTGDEAKRVKALAKPTVVPWAVNQLYWKARSAYERLLSAGEKLRRAQIAALEGRGSTLRDASSAHREAVAAAAKRATELASVAGVHPSADDLARMVEAISLASKDDAEPAGRFTEVRHPAGFEALSGVRPFGKPATSPPSSSTAAAGHEEAHAPEPASATRSTAVELRQRAAERKQQVELQRRHREAERERQARITEAEGTLDRARAAEAKARRALEQATDAVKTAEHALAAARSPVSHS